MFSEDRSTGMIPFGDEGTSLMPTRRTLSPVAIMAAAATDYATTLAIKNASSLAAHEQCRALLTKAALDNVAALSALEAHLCRVAPWGEERYRLINDTYALGAAIRLGRW